MEQRTVTETGAEPTLTLLAEQADGVLFDALGVDDFSELAFYTNTKTGVLVATTNDVDAFVRLQATETGLSATESVEIDEEEITEIEITEPEETIDADGEQTRRGD